MTSTLRHVVLTLSMLAAILLGAFVLEQVAFHVGSAHAQGITDAGVGSGSGSAAAIPTSIPNPVDNPAGFIDTFKTAKSIGWPILVLIAGMALLEFLAWIGTKSGIAWLSWLGKGRISVVISGLTAIASSMLNALASGGTWISVLVVATPLAIALFYHPAGIDPKKA